MRKAMWALVLCLGMSLAQADMDLETVLGKVESGRAGLDNCMFVVASKTVRPTTMGQQVTGTGTDKLMLADGRGRQETQSTMMRGETKLESQSEQAWDGETLYSHTLRGATPYLTITKSTNKGTLYGNMFPEVASWKGQKDVAVAELDNGMIRISSDQRVTVLDPKHGCQVVVDARVMRSPLMPGRVFNNVAVYENYKQSRGGAWYPTRLTTFSPPELQLATVTGKMAPGDALTFTTREVSKADFRFKAMEGMGQIQPQPGWQVADYTKAPPGQRSAMNYVYRAGMTEADIKQMSDEYAANAAKQMAAAAAQRKAVEDARAHLLNNPHPTLASLEFFSGPTTNVKDLEGKVVLLDFWATWCGWCTRSLPQIKAWNEKYAAQGLVVVGINSDKNDIATDGKIKAFLEKEGTVHTIALDKTGAIKTAYGVSGIPQFYLIDRNGVVVHGLTGYGGPIEGREGSGEGFKTMEAKIQAALAAKPEGKYQVRDLEAPAGTRTSKAE